MEVYKDDHFSEYIEEKCAKTLCDFHRFKDSHVELTKKSKKNENQRSVVSTTNYAIQNEEDGVKRGAVSWEEALFLEQHSPAEEIYYLNLKKEDDHCVCNILEKFKNQQIVDIHM